MRIVPVLALCSVLGYYGCQHSNLDLLPHGPTEKVFFSTENEFTQAVNGVYAKMTDLYGWVTFNYAAGPDATLMPVYLLLGDDITTNRSPEEFEQFGPLQPSSGRVANFYSTLYQMIARANTLHEKIDAENGVYTTPNLKNYHSGEALFLRGFAYYYLWNYFGTAPMNTARVTSTSQFTPPNTTGTQLLDQAIADFTKAASLLPQDWNAANKGRATKNSAYGFLGKSLVFRASATKTTAGYTPAIAAFNSINGASLSAKFDDNFALDTENNAESLFEFQASQSPGNNIWLPNDFDNAVGNMSIAWNYYTGDELYGNSKFYGTTKLQNAFNAADPRLRETVKADGSVEKYVKRNGKLMGWQNSSADNYRLLRYADVLLLKAEAILQSGGSTTEAINLVNQVRKRAREMASAGVEPADRNTAETNKTTIMDWIMTERLLELAGEGQRWFDLRRWHMQGIITLNNAFFSSNTQTISFDPAKHLLLPIPTRELDVNPNVKQNTGY